MSHTLLSKLDALNELDQLHHLPNYIKDNLNSTFELRPYQIEAFRRFITYFSTDTLREYPSRSLFHMATGSGKTLIMAGLILFLYTKGYRNFIFFVNATNIIDKTKDNFLNTLSSKYLFNTQINIGGKKIRVVEVDNFQNASADDINIYFTTIQGLHFNLNFPKENSISIDDFSNQEIVLLSDEAHHINASTKKGKLTPEEESWQYTVEKIFHSQPKNILLEFTATMDLKNKFIKAKYENHIVFEYLLTRFRQDKYSKDVQILQTNLELFDRSLLAIILSQYRLKIFQKHNYNIKPVVMLKSKTIAESCIFEQLFHDKLNTLTSEYVDNMLTSLPDDQRLITTKLKNFLYTEYETLDNFILELKNDFSSTFTLNVNKEDELIKNQVILNTLEERTNPYRLIFAVNKLDEGWDVLNLFDIVRLYNTRDADHKEGKIGKTTMSEAQLIGRGARYCPFIYEEPEDKYLRKFDNDLEHELRICEELYYHSQQNSRYIHELRTALIEQGILDEEEKITLVLKEDFKDKQLYKLGSIFVNSRYEVSNDDIYGLNSKSKDRLYSVILGVNAVNVDNLLTSDLQEISQSEATSSTQISLKNISLPVLRKGLMKFPIFEFNTLKKYFPHLNSLNQFILDDAYLGGIKIQLKAPTNKLKNLTPSDKLTICLNVFDHISNDLIATEKRYRGSETFKNVPLRDTIKNKTITVSRKRENGVGISQNNISNPRLHLNVSNKPWYVYTDNFGTDQEKYLTVYFDSIYDKLSKLYDEVYLIRNERAMHLYSFDEGLRFEPDFILILRKTIPGHNILYHAFIEPKGAHLKSNDAWKEKFLLQLVEKNLKVIKNLYEDSHVRILGLPFYNNDNNKEFDSILHQLFMPELGVDETAATKNDNFSLNRDN